MKLPNASKAFVDVRKLIEYVLDFDNPRGRHKARVFRAAFGITGGNANDLIRLSWKQLCPPIALKASEIFMVKGIRLIVRLSLTENPVRFVPLG